MKRIQRSDSSHYIWGRKQNIRLTFLLLVTFFFYIYLYMCTYRTSLYFSKKCLHRHPPDMNVHNTCCRADLRLPNALVRTAVRPTGTGTMVTWAGSLGNFGYSNQEASSRGASLYASLCLHVISSPQQELPWPLNGKSIPLPKLLSWHQILLSLFSSFYNLCTCPWRHVPWAQVLCLLALPTAATSVHGRTWQALKTIC